MRTASPTRRVRWPVLLLVGLAVCLPVLPGGAAAEPPPAAEEEEAEPFGEVISVSLLAFRARILDASGVPIPNLTPADLSVRAAGKALSVLSVDFVDQAVEPGEAADTGPVFVANERVHQASSKGQLFVVFVETAASTRPKGRKPRIYPTAHRGRVPEPLKRLLAALEPEDQVAVVTHGEELTLALDFSRDREAAWRAIERAAREEAAVPVPSGPLSLAADWKNESVKGAAQALVHATEVLTGLPGEKVLVYVAVGDARFEPISTHPPEIEELFDVLTEAHATVFALAPRGTLNRFAQEALGIVSASTGGLFLSMKNEEVDRLARAVDGYHVVTLDAEEVGKAPAGTPITVELAGRKGSVLMAPLSVLRGYE